MSDKILISRLDGFIDAHRSRMQNDFKEFQPAYEKELSMFTEIKQALLEMSYRNDDNDLVEKIFIYLDECGLINEEMSQNKYKAIRSGIRKLLQGKK